MKIKHLTLLSFLLLSFSPLTGQTRHGESFYTGLQAYNRGDYEDAITLLQEEWNFEASSWRYEAAKEGIRILIEYDKYSDASEWAVSAFELSRDFEFLQYSVQILVQRNQWQDAQNLLTEFRSGLENLDRNDFLFYEALCALSLGQTGVEDLVWRFFLQVNDREQILKIESTLKSGSLWQELSSNRRIYIDYRTFFAQNKYASSYALWKQLEDSLRYPKNVGEIGDIQAMLRGAGRSGLIPDTLMEVIVKGDTSSLHYYLYEQLGQYYRSLGNYSLAEEHFSNAMELGSARQKQRMLWYQLDAIIKASPHRAVDEFDHFVQKWTDSDYFLDAIENLMSELIRDKDWDRVMSLAVSASANARPETMAAIHYYLGLVDLYSGDTPKHDTALRQFESAAQMSPDTFYGRMGAIMTGSPLPLSEEKSPSSFFEWSGNFQHRYIKGFFDYGLFDEGFQLVLGSWRTLPEGLIRWTAEILQQNDYYGYAYRLGWFLRWKGVDPQNPGDLMFLYPRAYPDTVDSLLEESFRPVFFSLMRTESAFNPETVSSAGAQGLCQLLPSTAKDVSGRTGLESDNLFDPEQNIALGAWYIEHMIDRTSSLTRALASYNAGNGRVRSWEKDFGDYAELLFLESIPFRETRNYVKKVLESSFYYGYLYGDVQPVDLVRRFFPDINIIQ